jgi:hypothetical protein
MRVVIMTKMMFALAAATVLGTLAVAPADIARTTSDEQQAATILCRPAAAGERPTAMTTKSRLICKKMDGAGMINGKGCPKIAGLSAAQVDAAWRELMYSTVIVRSGDGG